MTLLFNKMTITCENCKESKQLTTNSEIAKTRLQHIFDLVLASLCTQGYKQGYLCRKCEKKLGFDTKDVRKWLKKHFTHAYFEARKNVRLH